MFPNSLTLETGLQQALDLCPPRSVSKAEFDPAEQQLRGLLCATPGPMPARPAPRCRWCHPAPLRRPGPQLGTRFSTQNPVGPTFVVFLRNYPASTRWALHCEC